jgi:hypothetical protein
MLGGVGHATGSATVHSSRFPDVICRLAWVARYVGAQGGFGGLGGRFQAADAGGVRRAKRRVWRAAGILAPNCNISYTRPPFFNIGNSPWP